MNQTQSFDSGLGTNMRKAAHPLDGMVSSNLRLRRGERGHHHGGGVCWLFVLLWIDLGHHKLIVCKKWNKNNPKEGLCGVTFWPTLACTTPWIRTRIFSCQRLKNTVQKIRIPLEHQLYGKPYNTVPDSSGQPSKNPDYTNSFPCHSQPLIVECLMGLLSTYLHHS